MPRRLALQNTLRKTTTRLTDLLASVTVLRQLLLDTTGLLVGQTGRLWSCLDCPDGQGGLTSEVNVWSVRDLFFVLRRFRNFAKSFCIGGLPLGLFNMDVWSNEAESEACHKQGEQDGQSQEKVAQDDGKDVCPCTLFLRQQRYQFQADQARNNELEVGFEPETYPSA